MTTHSQPQPATIAASGHTVSRTAEPALDVTATIPGVPSKVRAKIDALVTESRSLADTMDALKLQRAEIDDQIKTLCDKHELTALDCTSGKVRRYYTGDRKKLDPALLLKNGVSMVVIEKSTVVTPGKLTYSIKGLKGDGD